MIKKAEEKTIVKNYTVRELMIPLSEYATVSVGATLYEAVLALEEAQLDFDLTRYRHRAILVLDEKGNVVGKISQLDVLSALEPKYNEILEQGKLQQHHGLTKKYLESIMTQYNMWDSDLSKICRKSGKQPVTKFMHTLTEGEYVDENATLAEAIHQLVMGHKQSLMVTRNNKISGILRLTDVFASVFHTMKQCCGKDK
jgi:CBS domain-containing protein